MKRQLFIKKIGSKSEMSFDESLALPTGVYNQEDKKLLFKSDSASEAIQWAIDYVTVMPGKKDLGKGTKI